MKHRPNSDRQAARARAETIESVFGSTQNVPSRITTKLFVSSVVFDDRGWRLSRQAACSGRGAKRPPKASQRPTRRGDLLQRSATRCRGGRPVGPMVGGCAPVTDAHRHLLSVGDFCRSRPKGPGSVDLPGRKALATAFAELGSEATRRCRGSAAVATPIGTPNARSAPGSSHRLRACRPLPRAGALRRRGYARLRDAYRFEQGWGKRPHRFFARCGGRRWRT